MLRPLGTLVAIGCLPPPMRERFGIAWSPVEQRRFERLAVLVRAAVRPLPRRVDRWAPPTAMRVIGARTRRERYRPPPAR
ncbi:oxygenase MpaB family protein [Actinomadura fibrosa]|uniref:Oxygenase MpaB family protein n=1 Tax=Actinomadura fibrosa TaxID=111802 RepID=A0ABW2XWP9_9ACTN|nr:oxygenase MpaB family protein [Actinomadura fibrosa]